MFPNQNQTLGVGLKNAQMDASIFPVAAGMSELKGQIGLLSDQIESLTRRIDSILTPISPEKGECGQGAPAPLKSSLASDLDNQLYRLRDLVSAMQLIESRVEL